MKTPIRLLRYLVSCFIIVGFATNLNGQLLKKLGKRAEKAAERTVELRVERETQKKTDAALDSILEPGSKGEQERRQNPPSTGGNNQGNAGNPQDRNTPGAGGSTGGPKTIQVYSKFDFVPGDKLLFFDDFSNDFVGDFPSKWNTNSSGELVQIGDSPSKWLNILPGFTSKYIPDVTDLPEEFTLEFDVMTKGLNKKTSSQSFLAIIVGDNNSFLINQKTTA